MHESLRQFHPVIGRWFEERLGIPTPPQVLGWPVIGAEGGGKSCLILAPTGSGKTLAAFLACIDWLARRLIGENGHVVPPSGGSPRNAHTTPPPAGTTNLWGVQILYVSPLKSLANDVQKNLLAPLREIADVAAKMKIEWPEIQVAVRTGDTPQKTRAAIARHPPHILITTPESLNLMLTSASRSVLSSARYLIVDEVHALAGAKRGVFLSLILERLEHDRTMASGGGGANKNPRGQKIAPGVYIPADPFQPLIRVGLSATARPEDRIAHWLGGNDDHGNPRPVAVVRSGQRKRLDLAVLCPFAAAEDLDQESTENPKPKGTGHWPEVTRTVLQLIRDHRSTLVFGNSRRLIESLAARFQEELLNETAYHEAHPEKPVPRIPVILPHHGSIAKDVRLETEQALKRGELDAVLATSSLELGIDIGALDLVVQIDSPGNVAAALQRVGRAGHLEKATAKGRLLARGNFALASLAALIPLMYEGVVEETHGPLNCLDVLSQQIVAACVVRPWKRSALYRTFRRATPFTTLTEKQFDSVIHMLSKRAERVTSQGLRPRLSFDRVNDELIIMPGAASVLMMNSGVISDTGAFPVYLINGKKGRIETAKEKAPREAAQEKSDFHGLRIGELDEEFVYETKEGDRIVLGSQTWRVVRIDADRVLVEPATPGSSRMPFWRGEQAPRSEMLGEAVAKFYTEIETRLAPQVRSTSFSLSSQTDESTRDWLQKSHHLTDQAAENAITYFHRQITVGALPNATRIVVEHFTDRTGEPIIAILCPLGSRINYTLRLALEAQFANRRLPAQLVHSDDGIIIRPPAEVGEIPENPLAWLRVQTLEPEIIDQLETSSLFGLRFRQNAARALMLPRMNVTQRTPLWQQRLRARHLLALVKKERNFPIIVETYRECLQDVLGIPRVQHLLGQLERGELSVQIIRNTEPSPFARSLFSQFTQSYLYAWDDPLTHTDIEPAVDQTILDEILQRRGPTDSAPTAAPAWEPADEAALARRIIAADYPARTAEELLEKIEAAGSIGIPFADATDPRWAAWSVGGAQHAAEMLNELTEKRRIVRIQWPGASGHRYLATENLAPLLAALPKRPSLAAPTRWVDLPAALIKSNLTPPEARRLLIEQSLKSRPVTTAAEIIADLPFLEKQIPHILADLLHQGFTQQLPDEKILWTEYAEQLRSLALRRQRRAANTADVAALQRHLLHWQHLENPREGLDALEDALDMFVGLSFPLELWELEILPQRVKDFAPAMLDGICLAGHRVWVGGPNNSIAFWPRHLLPTRPVPLLDSAKPLSDTAQKILTYLQKHGASFLLDIQLPLNLDDSETALALQQLAYSGKISNDQLEGLREVNRLAENAKRNVANRPEQLPQKANGRYPVGIRGPAPHRKLPTGWWKSRTSANPAQSLGGRWFLLPEPQPTLTALDLTERAADKVERFLRRTAFACRELLTPEIDGPWKDCYDVLTRMEWAGTVRRGYFIEGISGSQFAAPGTRFDQTSAPPQSVHWLSTLDPANIWSQVNTRWLSDSGEPLRIPRAPGNWIALIDGRPVLAALNSGHRLIPLPASPELHQLALASFHTLLARLPRHHRPHLDVRQWDQQDIVGSPADDILRHTGFTRDTQGFRLYRQYIPHAGATSRLTNAAAQQSNATPEGEPT